MALWGPIHINDQMIGTWSAVRKEEVFRDQSGPTFNYECEIRLNMSHAKFLVTHRYRDGALVLGAKVMEEAHRVLEGSKVN